MRPGRLIRQQAADRANDSASAGHERVAYRQAMEQAVAEREVLFGLDWSTAAEAMKWQEKRIAELLNKGAT